MISQKNNRLLKDIQEVGCLYLCLVRMCEMLYNYEYEIEQVNAVWELAVKRCKIVNREMKDPDSVINMLREIARIESDKKIVQIGQTVNGVTQYWGWVKDKYKENVYTMAMEKTNGAIGTHFVLVKSYKEPIITYDSWDFTRIGVTTKAQRFIYYAVI